MTSLDDVWLVQWLPAELVHLIHDCCQLAFNHQLTLCTFAVGNWQFEIVLSFYLKLIKLLPSLIPL